MTTTTEPEEEQETPSLANLLENSSLFELKLSESNSSFHVHRALLIKYSSYFASLFSFNGQEAQEGSATFDDDPEAFRLFVTYLYQNEYRATVNPDDTWGIVHAKVYVLADRFLMDDLKNRAARNAAESLASMPDVEGNGPLSGTDIQKLLNYICFIYSSTARTTDPKNEMRILLARLAVRTCKRRPTVAGSPWFEKLLRDFPDFAVDMIAETNCRRKFTAKALPGYGDDENAVYAGNDGGSPELPSQSSV